MNDRTCSVDGCDRPVRSRSYCALHYSRWLKHGDPLVNLIGSGRSNIERFMSHVVLADNGCWIWTASRYKSGYGRFTPTGNNAPVYAHRWSFEHHVSPITPSLLILHSCNNRACVNPAHLRQGTVKQNSADSRIAGTIPEGEKAANARLTERDVFAIRRMWATRQCTIQSLATSYDVSQGCINGVIYEKTWKHLLTKTSA